jgi:hypothetical protein
MTQLEKVFFTIALVRRYVPSASPPRMKVFPLTVGGSFFTWSIRVREIWSSVSDIQKTFERPGVSGIWP